jgi:hypothetical protein
MPAILLYGIYGGVTTPTEAAAIAALYALLLAGLVLPGAVASLALRDLRRKRPVLGGRWHRHRRRAHPELCRRVGKHPRHGRQGAGGHRREPPLVFLLGQCAASCCWAACSTRPRSFSSSCRSSLPTCRELGIDLVHFGVVAVVNCMIGLITPPYGILLFVINAVTRIPLREIIGEVWPFLIVLWLPRMFGYPG